MDSHPKNSDVKKSKNTTNEITIISEVEYRVFRIDIFKLTLLLFFFILDFLIQIMEECRKRKGRKKDPFFF